MSDYKAPQRDMLFALNELAELPNIAQLPPFEEATPELVETIIEEASKLAEDIIAPLNWPGHQEGVRMTENHEVISASGFKQAYRAYIDSGWNSLPFDTQYGGQGMPAILAVPIMENWHAACMSWGLCPLLSQGAIEALSAKATDEIKQRYLPDLISGNWTGTMNLTEPQAGTDLALLKTSAKKTSSVEHGEHYRLKGQKIFITWGEHDMAENILHLVLARTADAPAGVKGISLFLVPKFLVNDDGSCGQRNDCKVIALEEKMGIHASPTCVMSFGDGDGAIGYLIGEENKGLAVMFIMMNSARLSVGLQGVSIAERAYQRARDYARDRQQGIAPGNSQTTAIIHHPDVRRMLMTMRALTEASRGLAYSAFASVDHQHHSTELEQRRYHSFRSALLTPIVKGWCTEIAQEVTSMGIQIHGGMGFIEETKAAQYYLDARILPIYEGTNGIQAMDLIGRKTLGDQGAAMNLFIDEMMMTITAGNGMSSLIDNLAASLQEAIAVLKQCIEDFLQQSSQDANLSGSAAFNYLLLVSYISGGWIMLKSAIAAEAHLQADAQSNPDKNQQDHFYQDKIITAQFYIEQILPRYLGYAKAMEAGSTNLMALPEAHF